MSRLAKLSEQDKRKFIPLCPDFLIEIGSPSDELHILEAKMFEYREAGLRLGWLILPESRKFRIYHGDGEVRTLDAPEIVTGEPVLPGFELDLARIWDPPF
jgi:Uma2 family endonuclease